MSNPNEVQATDWYKEWFGDDYYRDAGHAMAHKSLVTLLAIVRLEGAIVGCEDVLDNALNGLSMKDERNEKKHIKHLKLRLSALQTWKEPLS